MKHAPLRSGAQKGYPITTQAYYHGKKVVVSPEVAKDNLYFSPPILDYKITYHFDEDIFNTNKVSTVKPS